MLVLSQLNADELVYDLGSGDGRVVIMAAEEFGARAVGVELRDDLVKRAHEKIFELGLDSRVKIVQSDLF